MKKWRVWLIVVGLLLDSGRSFTMQRIECRRWDDLLDAFDGLDVWVFRGHCSANWRLESTLERRAPEGTRRLYTEYQLVREFRRRAHNYLGAHDLPTSDGEWLALMQHFGAPTRLLDFTASPYVAAYFAFEDLPADGCSHCAIFAVDPTWCASRLGALGFERGGMLGIGVAALQDGVNTVMAGRPRSEGLDMLAAGDLLRAFVEQEALTSSLAMVAVLDLKRLSERMSAQQGLFFWPGDVDQTFMQNLEALGDSGDNVRQFIVPVADRGRALEQLRLMNITRTSLFPGLEGFAQSFRQLTVREPRESRNVRAALRGLRDAMRTDRTDTPGAQ